MSQVLSEDVKEVVYKKVRTLTGIKCDICGKVIPAKSGKTYNDRAEKYFKVVTGHNDWGNDSCESREYFDICPECIGTFVQQYLTDPKGYDTRYIKIEMERCCFREVSE